VRESGTRITPIDWEEKITREREKYRARKNMNNSKQLAENSRMRPHTSELAVRFHLGGAADA
jgi:hypothetical protein